MWSYIFYPYLKIPTAISGVGIFTSLCSTTCLHIEMWSVFTTASSDVLLEPASCNVEGPVSGLLTLYWEVKTRFYSHEGLSSSASPYLPSGTILFHCALHNRWHVLLFHLLSAQRLSANPMYSRFYLVWNLVFYWLNTHTLVSTFSSDYAVFVALHRGYQQNVLELCVHLSQGLLYKHDFRAMLITALLRHSTSRFFIAISIKRLPHKNQTLGCLAFRWHVCFQELRCIPSKRTLSHDEKYVDTGLNTSISGKDTRTSTYVSGHQKRLITGQFLESHLVPGSSLFSECTVYTFHDYVDKARLENYPAHTFVQAMIPIQELFTLIPVAKARKIATLHNIPAGSRCNFAELMARIDGHSCIQCNMHVSIFVRNTSASAPKSSSERVARH